MVGENRDLGEMKKKLDQTWDLSGASSIWETGLDAGAKSLFDLMFRKLNHTITAILKSVTVLASLGPDLFRLSREFKSASQVQEDKINEISNAGQRISQGVQEISARTQTLTQDFGGMKTEVSSALEKGDRSMAEFGEIKDQVAILVETIQVLKENSDSIGSIIDVINNISDETNILSLNARIEAARGSAEGKGFKVIAEEVGNLAKQSKTATLDIQKRLSLLEDKIKGTVEGVERVEENVMACEERINKANTALNHVCERFGDLSENLEEINEAAVRQAEDVSQVSGSIMGIESALGEQARDADAIFTIAEQVNSACDQMVVDTGVFHLSGHNRARQTAVVMAGDPCLISGSRSERERALKGFLDKNKFIELAYITDARGCQTTVNIYSEKLKGRSGLENGLDRNWASKEWFKVPVQTCRPFVSKVYRSSATQNFCFTVSVPLNDRDGCSGVIGIDINFRDMLNI